MLETMYDAPGIGLAAPQVGVLHRLIVLDCVKEEGAAPCPTVMKQAQPSPVVFVNPKIVEASESRSDAEEACLSIPGITTFINRPDWVILEWTDARGETQRQRLDGAWARCAQHELDHLNGIVTFDRLDAPARHAAETQYAVQR
ncbi:UNVERIFIED_CONTAM: hypothetical protein GTU68_059466 [Idotea baltica]|nr:hypothetical protein [Idotea baltica]